MSEPDLDHKKGWRARNPWLIAPVAAVWLFLSVVPRACDVYDSTLDRAPLLTIHNRSDAPVAYKVESTPVLIGDSTRLRGAGHIMPGLPATVRFLPGDQIVCWGEHTGAVTTPLQFAPFVYIGVTDGRMHVFTEARPLPEPRPSGDP